jgi:hypothetical protein
VNNREPPAATSRRTVQVGGLPPDAEGERRLRALLRRALSEAMVPGLALGMAACGGRGGLATKPVVSVPDGAPPSDGSSPPDSRPDGAPVPPSSTPDASAEPEAALPDFMTFPCSSEWFLSSGLNTPAPFDLLVPVKTCPPPGSLAFSCSIVLEVTEGGTTRKLATNDELFAFLGPIDTPREALLVLYFYDRQITCDDPNAGAVREVPGGYEVKTRSMRTSCPVAYDGHTIFVTRDGLATTLETHPVSGPGAGGCVGRRPEGLETAARPEAWTLATFLGDCATLEAASIAAFDELACDLEALGAPEALSADARAFAGDEVRHAAVMSAQAARFGGAVGAPRVAGATTRKTLRELCHQNAIEGCVRETFGALVADFQAATARDAQLGAELATIAQDEARHARLAWRIAEWAEPLLEDDARAELATARRAAIAALREELSREHAPEVHALAGWPAPAQGRALVDALDRLLWS